MSRPYGIRLAGVCALLVALAGSVSLNAAGKSDARPPSVPGEIIVGFKPGVSHGRQRRRAPSHARARRRSRCSDCRRSGRSRRTSQEGRLEDALKQLENDPRVRYAEPNYVVRASVIPDDPSFSQLSVFHNTGQNVNSATGTPDADIDAPRGMGRRHRQLSIVVASIDTSIDFSHPDLGGSATTSPLQWVNPGENCGSGDATIVCAQRANGVDNDADGYVDDWRGWNFVSNANNPLDDHGHGTHTMGTVAGRGNNGIGVTGVNWTSKVMSLKFLDSFGGGPDDAAAAAVLYAANMAARSATTHGAEADSRRR